MRSVFSLLVVAGLGACQPETRSPASVEEVTAVGSWLALDGEFDAEPVSFRNDPELEWRLDLFEDGPGLWQERVAGEVATHQLEVTVHSASRWALQRFEDPEIDVDCTADMGTMICEGTVDDTIPALVAFVRD